MPESIRIAAIGDLHIRTTVPSAYVQQLIGIEDRADLLLVPGDITNGGRIQEVELAAELFRRIEIPIIGVLGNHDRRTMRRKYFVSVLEEAGVRMLDGEAWEYMGLGIAGVSGSGGGFWPDEPEDPVSNRAWQALAVRARREAARLDRALSTLATQRRLAMLHFSPTTSTLVGEPPVKYWLLGNSALGHIVEKHQVDMVIHGHSHIGSPVGETPGGVPVFNVAAGVTGGVSIHTIPLDPTLPISTSPLMLARV
ncbi:MAG: metallophosphoesterase [Thermomicrobiales bacterium]|nr:metallophosphoesterase [Thermomicrobiales bacterium]MCO5220391.1 metallophosphoesterase [Thermomicrobiales bacterium]